MAVSVFATGVSVGASVVVWNAVRESGGDPMHSWVALLPLAIVIAAALFAIRGYSLERDSIIVQRPLWATRLPRTGLISATHDPAAVRGGMRVFGNGGLFSFSGWFRNKQLGTYRAYITDHSRAVVLRYSNRIVVVSPGDPERFVRDVMRR